MSARRIVLIVLAALASLAPPAAFAEGADKGFAGLGADAAGFDQADPGNAAGFPAGFWRASRFSHGMVVSDRQSRGRIRRRLRRAMDAVPPGRRAARRAPGLGQPDGLDGPCGGDHRDRASVRRNLRPRRRRTGRRDRAAVSRVDRRLEFSRRAGGRAPRPGARARKNLGQRPGLSLCVRSRRRQAARSPGRQRLQPQIGRRARLLLFQPALLQDRRRPRRFMDGRSSCRALRGWIGNGAASLSPRPRRVGTGFRCISRPARS